ncbi:MAG: histidinol-phosphatase [Muribaculaceae bacterium]|nr:histidinol-phosphatase [Muribaculaceae bacterium]
MSRFKEIYDELRSTRRYNLHSHTQFCDGHAPMQQMVEGAIAAGITHYGFSPHSPLPIQSPCNMSACDVPAYAAEVERLRDVYGHRIRLYKSMEVDYLGPQWGPASDAVASYGLDYVIGSVHFVPSQDGRFIDTDGPSERFAGYVATEFHNDLRYVVDTFFSQTIAMIEAGGLDIVGHFDKIGLNTSFVQPGIEDEPWYGRHIAGVVDAIAAAGITAEINTKACARRGRFFPASRWWPLLKKAGVPVVVNSDAHDPALTDASRPEAFNLLDSLR